VVPFLVEDELLRLDAIFEKKANWQPFSITDGRLVTEQNPASSTSAAQALFEARGCEKGSLDSEREICGARRDRGRWFGFTPPRTCSFNVILS